MSNSMHDVDNADAKFTKRVENTEGKGEIARDEQFLLFQQSFLPFMITFCHFHQISTHLDNFLLFSSNLKSSSANSFNLE